MFLGVRAAVFNNGKITFTMVKSRSPNDSSLSELMGAIYLVLQVPRFSLRQMCVTYLTAGNRGKLGKAAYVPWYSVHQIPDAIFAQ
jgi:hypothetical protein